MGGGTELPHAHWLISGEAVPSAALYEAGQGLSQSSEHLWNARMCPRYPYPSRGNQPALAEEGSFFSLLDGNSSRALFFFFLLFFFFESGPFPL